MAAGKWYRITNITDNDTAGSLDGLSGYLTRECEITCAGTAAVKTPHFDWNVGGDFTIAINSGAKDIAGTYSGANCKIIIEGSVNGDAYTTLDESSLLALDTLTDSHVYDFDQNGLMPYMRLSLRGHGSGVDVIKIAVIPH